MRLRAVAALVGLAPISAGMADPIAVLCTEPASGNSDGRLPQYFGDYQLADGHLARKSSSVRQFFPMTSRTQPAPDADGISNFNDAASVGLFFRDGSLEKVIFNDHPHLAIAGTAKVGFTLLRDGQIIATDPSVPINGGFLTASFPAAVAGRLTQAFDLRVTIDGAEIGTAHFPALPVKAATPAALALLSSANARFSGSAFDPQARGDATACHVAHESGCFLTTAAVGAVGLADDCWELTTLRAFRDRLAAAGRAPAAAIADYYEIAPIIVESIGARPDACRIWLNTWARGIVPAAAAASLGLDRIALWFYRRMTLRLNRLGRPDTDPQFLS
jgi:hypothetical protein